MEIAPKWVASETWVKVQDDLEVPLGENFPLENVPLGENVAGNGILMCVPSTIHLVYAAFGLKCKYKHICGECAGSHPAKACTFKPRNTEQ